MVETKLGEPVKVPTLPVVEHWDEVVEKVKPGDKYNILSKGTKDYITLTRCENKNCILAFENHKDHNVHLNKKGFYFKGD
jgi:hypothetical protein